MDTTEHRTTAELTNQYIKDHPEIKRCLKKGIVNYSSLARLIAKDLGIEKKTSKEAILIAARRFKMSLAREEVHEKELKALLSSSEVAMQNRMAVFITTKMVDLDAYQSLEREIHAGSGSFYLLEGSASYTIITQERFAKLVKQRLGTKIIKQHAGLALLTLKTGTAIESIPGVVAYVTSLFAENGVNIVEFLSCWTDTLFVVKESDVPKALGFLKFD